MSAATEIGYFEPIRLAITCEREPEVGISWMACCKELSLCALGATPREAGRNLMRAINEAGIGGSGRISEEACLDANRDIAEGAREAW